MKTADLTELTLADRAIDHLVDVMDSLTSADLDRPTPCGDWRVRDLLAHISGTAAALAGFARTGRRELPERLVPLDDPLADAARAITAIRAALADDAADPDNVRRAAGDVAVEFTTHAWDLDPRRALPADLAAGVFALVAPVVDDTLRAQFFGPEVPVGLGVSASDRLVAFLGRDPGSV